ncbi:MAG TPA: restriction endonuclease, partial [Puia sp.]|nr:restriction endonuclease [Puia sp.]
MGYSDEILERKIADLQNSILNWAKKNNIWTDSCFKTYFEAFGDEPSDSSACVCVLISEGGIFQMLNGYNYSELLTGFNNIIHESDFYLENYNHYQFQFFCRDEDLNQAYLDYYEWKWICELVKAGYTSLYEELFDYFNKNPKKLYNLPYRSFEVLISEVFRNQGYRTELGKGQGDGGIDVKLFKKEGVD